MVKDERDEISAQHKRVLELTIEWFSVTSLMHEVPISLIFLVIKMLQGAENWNTHKIYISKHMSIIIKIIINE